MPKGKGQDNGGSYPVLFLYLCKMNRSKAIGLILFVLSAAVIFSCTGLESYDRRHIIYPAPLSTDEQADSIAELLRTEPFDKALARKLWSYYARVGNFDALMNHATSIFKSSIVNNDYDFAVTAASYMALTYITLNERDSARFYLDFIKSHISQDDPLYGMYNNAESEYSVKFEWDYPKAIEYMINSLRYYQKTGNEANESVVLGNISLLYAKRRDTSGLKYAEMSYEKARQSNDLYAECFSSFILSQMEYYSGMYRESIEHAEEALSLTEANTELKIFRTELYTILADTYRALGRNDSADACYHRAFGLMEGSPDENVHISLYLSYADYLRGIGRYQEAVRHYMDGLRLADRSSNVDSYHYLLLGLSEAYDRLGQKDSALCYYKKYYDSSLKAFNLHKEKEFNQLFLDNERMKYENMLFQKEVQADRYKKTILIVSCVLAVLAILSAALYVVYKRKDKMYTLLVEQHQQLVRQRRLEEEKSTLLQSEGEDSKVHNEKLLFSRIEDMMKNGKIFKANDLTVEKLSEMLDSNRTYVSNVINKYAGMSFPNYLNQYRINEAVAVIADTRHEVVLKALCNDLGYNSMTSFYRAFQKETGCTPMIYREKMIKLNSRQGPHMT